MTTTATPTSLVTDDHIRQFREDGYFVLPNAMSDELIAGLRSDCDQVIDLIDRHWAENPDAVNNQGNINKAGSRYFIANQHFGWPHMGALLYGQLMADIAMATLGPDTYLFHEQWVVKAAEKGGSFSWHQDSGYLGFPHKPYLTCWCALDDVDESNGTVYILPQSRSGIRERVEHERDPENQDQVGYTGDDPGEPVIIPAGSVAVFSSVTFHRSGSNTTPKPRRAYVAQYSAEPIVHPDSGHVTNLAVPLTKGGTRVRRLITPEGMI